MLQKRCVGSVIPTIENDARMKWSFEYPRIDKFKKSKEELKYPRTN